MKFLLVFIGFLLATGCSTPTDVGSHSNDDFFAANQSWLSPHSQKHPLVGRLWNSNDNKFVDFESLLATLTEIDYLLIGERHDNPDHHRIKIQIIKQAQRNNRNTVITFEMIDDRQYSTIDPALLKPDISLAALKETLNWPDNNAWPWEVYGPVILTAVNGGSEIRPGNIDRRTLMQLGRNNTAALSEYKQELSTMAAFPEAFKQQVLEDVFAGHCELIPRDTLDPMVSIQIMRDAYMASSLYQNKQKRSSILVAGNGHIREDLGVGWHIRQRDPKADVLSIAIIEVEEGLTSAQDYLTRIRADKQAFDYIWFTPKFSTIDECEKLEATMQKKSKLFKNESK